MDNQDQHPKVIVDRALQCLIAMEMQVDLLRREAEEQSSPLASKLGRLQGLVREEAVNLRELLQQARDADLSDLPQFLQATIERFETETGIAANAGSRHVAANCCPRPMFMWSSLCRRNSLPWLCRTRK